MGDKPEAELKADLQLLLECLTCQQDNPNAAKQALLTISSICSSNSHIKEFFDECGGLEYVLNIISTTPYVPVKESALYCLGCCVERNASLQKKVSTSSVFSTLYGLLTSTTSGTCLRQTATFLILCIVANNSYGQVLAMRSGCLQALIHIFRSCLGSDQTVEFVHKPLDPVNLQLWTSVSSTLSMCVNNPQNDDNQRVCATLLPFMLKLLQGCQQTSILRPLASFIGLLVANNVYNQDRVRSCGGLEVIVSTIQRLHNQSRRDSDRLELTVHIVNTLDSCIADNASSVEYVGSHEAVRTLLSLLSEPDLDGPSQLQITLTLGHVTDQSETNQQEFLEAGGLTLMLQLMGEVEDEEMNKAVKFVLQSCVQSGNSDTSAWAGSKSKVTNQMNKAGKEIHQMYVEEPSNRLSKIDGMILEKINKLSDKLEAMEKSSVGVDKQLTISDFESLLKDSNINLSQPWDQFFVPGVSNIGQDVELSSQKKISNSAKFSQNRTFNENRKSSHLPKYCTIPQESDILTDLKNSDCLNSGEESSVPSGSYQDNSRSLKKKRKEIKKPKRGVRRNDQATVTKSEEMELQNNKCHLLEKIKKEQARCIALEKEKAFLQDKLAQQKPKEQTTEPINGSSSSSEQESVVPESVQENQSSISKQKRTGNKKKDDKFAEVSKKNVQNTVADAKVKWLQSDKEHLLDKLTKEQTRYEDLEMETVSLREHVAQQKHKEEEAEALREELEKQEREALSSQSSVESKENGQEIPYEATQNTETITNVSENNLCSGNKPCETEKKRENFLKPYAPSSRTSRSRIAGSASRRSNLRIQGGDDRNRPELRTNSNPSISLKSNACGKLTVEKLDLTRNVSVGGYLHPKPARPSSVYRYPTTNSRELRNSDTNFAGYARSDPKSRSSNRLSVSRTASIQSCDQFSEVDLNASFSSDITCMSAFDNNLMREAKAIGHQHSTPRGISRSSWSVKRVPQIMLSSTRVQRYPINHYHCTDTRKQQKTVYYDRNVWSVKPVRTGLKQLANRQPDNSDFDNHMLNDVNGDTWYLNPIQFKTSLSHWKDSNGLCPGCNSSNSCGLPCLNSRTFNIALETNPHTCEAHRHVRDLERLFIKKKNLERRQSLQKTRPLEALNQRQIFPPSINASKGDCSTYVYHFTSSEDEHAKQEVSPALGESNSSRSFNFLQENLSNKSRKLRVPYTHEETDNLLHGVRTVGKHWNQILCTYQFHPSRSAVDLMEKYKRMKANEKTQSVSGESELSNPAGPFSLCEERRLRRGVKHFGYNWKLILETYPFAKGRTKEELRSKWRSLHKRSLQQN